MQMRHIKIKSMLRIIVFMILAMAAGDAVAQQGAITTIILVRHAEKASDGSDDPDLKPEGHERAKRLAALLNNTTVNAIYTTRYKRTLHTVTPLAQAKGIEVKVYDSARPDVEGMLREHGGGTIVIGGHSNTLPQLANLLTGTDTFKTLPDTEYGTIYVVSVTEKGKGKVVVLSY
jgi:2,3-bisphosphoglycerate-dependent phosphoglycerate mutase